MSTRATYGFSSDRRKKQQFIYIHYDGYPTGAAVYFYNALLHVGGGNFATVFIRANPNAELTDSHEIHGDTEYKYDVTGYGPKAQIEAYKISLLGDRAVCFFSGLLHEFISRYSSDIPDFKPFREVNRPYYPSQIMTEDMAANAIKSPLANLIAWKGKYEGSGNWDSCVQDLKSIVAVFPNLLSEEMRAFV